MRISKILSFLLVSVVLAAGPVLAFDTSSNNFLSQSYYNNLLSNASWVDINSMSASGVQDFLNTNNSPLKSYSEGGRSAAQIIYDAAHGYNEASGDWGGISINTATGTVSPRVLLVYLQKEQSLITRGDLPENVLIKAMGYQCYGGVSNDNNGNNCNDRYEGFTKQVENAAWQLRYNYEYGIRGIKPTGFTTHYIVNEAVSMPDENGNRYNVTMANGATCAVYSYTPYVFDSAYNLWKYFNSWFTESAITLPDSTNDTAAYSLRTYVSSITVGGSKTSGSKVFYQNQLIADAGAANWQLTFTAQEGNNSISVEYRDSAGGVIGTKAISVVRHKIADINGDGQVDIQDLSTLANYWGQEHPAEALANLNPGEDEVVDIQDLSILASNWNG